MTSGLIENHEFFGWVLFAVVLIPLMLIGRKLERVESDTGSDTETSQTAPSPKRTTARGRFAALALVILFPLIIVGGSAMSSQASIRPVATSIDYSPIGTPWVRVFQKNKLNWMPQLNGADVQHEDVYFRSTSTGTSTDKTFAALGLYTYLKQQPGKKLVQWSNKIYDPGQWAVSKTFELTTQYGSPMSGLVLKGQRNDQKIYVAYAYYVEGTWVDSEVEAKLAPLLGAFNDRKDASLVAVGLECSADCDAEKELQALASKVEKNVRTSLDQRFSSTATDEGPRQKQ